MVNADDKNDDDDQETDVDICVSQDEATVDIDNTGANISDTTLSNDCFSSFDLATGAFFLTFWLNDG